jgi:phosphoribosylaminoimidazole-succinocarboxamide synthase
VLNQLSAWWCAQAEDLVDHHVLEVCDPNATIAVDAAPLPVEVVVRGHITGSTSTSIWTMYEAGERVVYGHRLPDGLHKNESLPRPIVTPTTKAEKGAHDEPVTVAEVVERGLVEAELWARVCDVALELFDRGRKVAAVAELILADTKYEFGLAPDGRLLLIDEVHTPDSSRYWKTDSYEERLVAGEEPESHDKEPVRLALRATGYRGDGDPPALPDEVWQTTSRRFVELYETLTGERFVPGEEPAVERIERNLRAAGVLSS